MAAVRRGDQHAFESLMTNYEPMLRAIVDSGLDAQLRGVIDGDDVRQEILITVYRKLPELEFRGPGAFRRWLRTIADSRLADLRRRHFCGKRRPRVMRSLEEGIGASPSGAEQNLADQVCASGPSPSSIVAGHEQERSLESILAAIPPHYRRLIEQTLILRRSTEEVARESGSNPAAVRKMVSRALQACKQVLATGGHRGPAEQAP